MTLLQIAFDAKVSTTELAYRIARPRDAVLAVSAAGSSSRDRVDEVVAAGPAVDVVGAVITTAQDPRKEALCLRQRLSP